MPEHEASRDTVGGSLAGTSSSADLTERDLVRSSTQALVASPALAGHVRSWLGDGENLPLTPKQVTEAIGVKQLEALAAKGDADPATLTETLAEVPPQIVDRLSPDGQLVTDPQVARQLLVSSAGGPGIHPVDGTARKIPLSEITDSLGLSDLSLDKITGALQLNPLLDSELVDSLINTRDFDAHINGR
ncbi:YidB family protein [Streptomyces sp. NPDC058289]|uniref:YidB family protein n=1 Tax=Streptomyces sp. NPDC058289 TaxID=3346425 RepID=UPI0036E9E5E6